MFINKGMKALSITGVVTVGLFIGASNTEAFVGISTSSDSGTVVETEKEAETKTEVEIETKAETEKDIEVKTEKEAETKTEAEIETKAETEKDSETKKDAEKKSSSNSSKESATSAEVATQYDEQSVSGKTSTESEANADFSMNKEGEFLFFRDFLYIDLSDKQLKSKKFEGTKDGTIIGFLASDAMSVKVEGELETETKADMNIEQKKEKIIAAIMNLKEETLSESKIEAEVSVNAVTKGKNSLLRESSFTESNDD